MLSSLIVLAGPLVFPGGEIDTLARSLESWSHRPVCALVQARRANPPDERGLKPDKDGYVKINGLRLKVDPVLPEWHPATSYGKFELELTDVGDGKELARLLRIKTKSKVEGLKVGEGIGLWEATWMTEGLGGRSQLVQPLPNGWTPATDKALTLKEDKLTADLGAHQAVTVERLAKLAWSKPVRTHWLFTNMWIVPALQGADEKATLSAVASAVSGKLVDEVDAWRIDLDPVAFRKRALATVRSRAPTDPRNALAAAHYRMAVEVWTWMDDATLLNLYRKPSVGGGMPVKRGTPLYTAISQYAAAYQRRAMDPSPAYAEEAQADRELLSRIDWNGEPTVLFGQNLGVSGGYPAIGGGTVMLT